MCIEQNYIIKEYLYVSFALRVYGLILIRNSAQIFYRIISYLTTLHNAIDYKLQLTISAFAYLRNFNLEGPVCFQLNMPRSV